MELPVAGARPSARVPSVQRFTHLHPMQDSAELPTTLSITVTDQITPTFNAIGPFCLNSIAPALPLTSTNGIIGTWNPATINTTAVGTTLYTFTPNAGQCGIGFAVNITIATQITPTFTQIGPLCQNSVAPSLPATSIEGVTGTWSPASISTTTAGTTTYTFTPSVGQCGSPVTMDIVIGGPSSIVVHYNQFELYSSRWNGYPGCSNRWCRTLYVFFRWKWIYYYNKLYKSGSRALIKSSYRTSMAVRSTLRN